MKGAGEAVKRFFSPHPALLLTLILGSAAGLFAVFRTGLQTHWTAYALYSIAAYTTMCVCIIIIRGIGWGRKAVHRNAFMHRYLTDLDFKNRVSLQTTFAVNAFYAFLKGIHGVLYHSPWFGALACYYIVLAAERFWLMQTLGRKENAARVMRRYKGAGYTLLILTPILLAIGLQAILNGESVTYPGHLIFAAAGFTFFSLGMAVYNLFRYRRLKEPIHLANKKLSMASAVVSLFFLQTAMLSAFDDGTGLAKVINPTTGIAVLLLVMGMGAYMIRDGSQNLKKL